ncbi:MAG: hypothetical protein ACI83O_000220 [Patescibacteria group bacterium]|jgi:hypothetical protein
MDITNENIYILSIDSIIMQEIIKEKYRDINPSARSPTLQTVLMVEDFINEHSGEYKKTQLFNSLPKKVMWETFQVIIEYLIEINKIAIDPEGKIGYIWSPNYERKDELKWA